MPTPESLIVADNTAEFMHDSALLFEINRKVLHPLGMALSFKEDPRHGIYPQGLVLVMNQDGTPLQFSPEDIADCEARLARFLSVFKAETEFKSTGPDLAIAE
jgi:hypothetical protein